ncbi:MAG: hypothetical protein V2A71_08030 [Candidatus Eisenbacteria bacterium]
MQFITQREAGVSLLVLIGFVLVAAGIHLDGGECWGWYPPEDPPDEDLPLNVYCTRPPYEFKHDVGKVTLEVTNLGFFGNYWNQGLNFGWEGGEYLYAAGLWIGAVDEDNVAHVSTGQYQTELRPSLGPVDIIYKSFEGIPGGRRFGPGGRGDDDNDGRVDEDFHNGYDDDDDGEIDEDFAAVGQQMLSCVFRDDTREARDRYSEHVPWGLRVEQRSFGWAVTGSNEFVGVDYKIYHEGSKVMRNTYVAFFVDGDAGPKGQENPGFWEDDLVGYTDTLVQIYDPLQPAGCQIDTIRIQIAYLWDAKDDGQNAKGGDVDGCMGVMFLGHKTDPRGITAPESVSVTTVRWFSSTAPYPAGDPQTDLERYDLMSSHRIPNRNATSPRDYRFVLCAGPFPRVEPGDVLPFQVAFVVGRRFEGMMKNAIAAQRIYNGRYYDILNHPTWGWNGKEHLEECPEPGCYKCLDDDCNGATSCVIIKQGQSLAMDLDCDPCTGVQGKESLVHWIGSTAPPPPAWNNDRSLPPDARAQIVPPAGDRAVVLQWDNTSEIVPDPLTGQFRFEGYRIWKAANWTRPIGETGPSSDLWMLLGDFAYHPADSLGTRSSRYVLNTKRWGGDTTYVICDTELAPVDSTTYVIPRQTGIGADTTTVYQYPIGRYTLVDPNVINGMIYFYSITPYAKWYDREAGQWIEIQSQPASSEGLAIIPRANSQDKLGPITVVPNPYNISASWDLIPSDVDPTGTKIGFFGLPRTRSVLRIFGLTGDLIRELEHDGSNGDGTIWWNLVTRNGQDVATGIYFFSVECELGTYIGKFVIIR